MTEKSESARDSKDHTSSSEGDVDKKSTTDETHGSDNANKSENVPSKTQTVSAAGKSTSAPSQSIEHEEDIKVDSKYLGSSDKSQEDQKVIHTNKSIDDDETSVNELLGENLQRSREYPQNNHSTPTNVKNLRNSSRIDQNPEQMPMYLNMSTKSSSRNMMSYPSNNQNLEVSARNVDIGNLMNNKIVVSKSEANLVNFLNHNKRLNKRLFSSFNHRQSDNEVELLIGNANSSVMIPENIMRSRPDPEKFINQQWERSKKIQNNFSEQTMRRTYLKPDIKSLRGDSVDNSNLSQNSSRKSLTCHSCKEFDINKMKSVPTLSNEGLYSSNKSLDGSRSKIKPLTLSKIAQAFAKSAS
ncbi:MAG: hypothetical protein MHMPM18_000035 [Marteilia pararefringens]